MKKKFKPAFDGIAGALRHRSVRLQFFLGLLAVLAGILLKLSYLEWIAFILCIGMVLTAELINTAIEFLCNRITTLYDPDIKVIKDVSSGAVLISSIAAAVIAFVIFLHHL